MPATIVPARPGKKAKPKSSSAPAPSPQSALDDRAEETTPAALCDRDRLLAALASGPFLTKEEGKLIRRVVQEARDASIADTID